jgi:hypothetical protein
MSGVTFYPVLTFAADAFTLISETILCVEKPLQNGDNIL